MKKLIIRKGTEKDFPAILELIKELAAFENGLDEVTNSLEKMQKEKKLFQSFVAEVNEEIIGFALYFFAYFTWVDKSLYLDDIYVKEAFRGQTIGSKLLRKIFEVAKKENCSRVRWQVLDWNHPAIKFYEKSGAKISKEWLNCDFVRKSMKKFLERIWNK